MSIPNLFDFLVDEYAKVTKPEERTLGGFLAFAKLYVVKHQPRGFVTGVSLVLVIDNKEYLIGPQPEQLEGQMQRDTSIPITSGLLSSSNVIVSGDVPIAGKP